MKKNIIKLLAIILTAAVLLSCAVACNSETKTARNSDTVLRFSAPEGTPALAMARLTVDCPTLDGTAIDYAVVSPSNIAAEMSSQKSDLVILPVNAGANLIRQGADYKLVSVAVYGSLFAVGKKDGGDGTLAWEDMYGKKVACIGKTGVPGLVFRYIASKNGITLTESGTPNAEKREILIQYVADGGAAKTLLASSAVDFAVVGEPAATAFKTALGCNAEMNLQTAYAECNENNGVSYPQAGLFARSFLAEDEAFMQALFSALAASKTWVTEHPTEITAFAKENLYESATFPQASIARCAIDGTALDEKTKAEILAFLANVAPRDGSGNAVDWQALAEKLF